MLRCAGLLAVPGIYRTQAGRRGKRARNTVCGPPARPPPLTSLSRFVFLPIFVYAQYVKAYAATPIFDNTIEEKLATASGVGPFVQEPSSDPASVSMQYFSPF